MAEAKVKQFPMPQTAPPAIEKGVPIPPKGGGRPIVYPFAEMDVGDSVLITNKTQAHASATSNKVGGRLGRKFTTRKVEGGIRVWRVS